MMRSFEDEKKKQSKTVKRSDNFSDVSLLVPGPTRFQQVTVEIFRVIHEITLS